MKKKYLTVNNINELLKYSVFSFFQALQQLCCFHQSRKVLNYKKKITCKTINLNNVTPFGLIDLLVTWNLIRKFTISFCFANYFQSIAPNKLQLEKLVLTSQEFYRPLKKHKSAMVIEKVILKPYSELKHQKNILTVHLKLL